MKKEFILILSSFSKLVVHYSDKPNLERKGHELQLRIIPQAASEFRCNAISIQVQP